LGHGFVAREFPGLGEYTVQGIPSARGNIFGNPRRHRRLERRFPFVRRQGRDISLFHLPPVFRADRSGQSRRADAGRSVGHDFASDKLVGDVGGGEFRGGFDRANINFVVL
jgi:hypothetical protein